MARPKKDPGEIRGSPIAFRPTDTERMIIHDKATMAGMTVSEYALTQCLHGQIVTHDYRRLDPAVFEELRRIGVNVNQHIRKAHIEGKEPDPDVKRLYMKIERIIDEDLAVKVTEPPAQNVVGPPALIVAVSGALTVTAVFAEIDVQPFESVTVT